MDICTMVISQSVSYQTTAKHDEMTDAESTVIHASIEAEQTSLEGTLQYRKGRSTGHSSLLWKKRFVAFRFADGGFITVYKDSPEQSSHLNEVQSTPYSLHTALSKIHKSLSPNSHRNILAECPSNVEIHIPSVLPWIAKDVENDSSAFVIEIPTAEIDVPSDISVATSASVIQRRRRCASEAEELSIASEIAAPLHQNYSLMEHANEDLLCEIANARSKGKPVRVYFRCDKGSNEKALWLKAFATIGRLSSEARKKRNLFVSLRSPLHLGNNIKARIRNSETETFARDVRQLELDDSVEASSVDLDMHLTNNVEQLVRGASTRSTRDREYRVQPAYAYPHRWMTRSELREEMVLPSEHFHDLRVPGSKRKEIGSLRVEVLQCLGLPKLERSSDTNAVVYLVCGSYAFATDVIPNQVHPMWLRKSRRACIIPLFDGFARLYTGVFHDEKGVKDDFVGRVVVDLARLRPRSTYDVTLPLRLSTHVYNRRRRGAIRMRITLQWKTERDALLSYIPKTLRIPLPQNSKPNLDVTVNCSDPKAFRNIAITVHGAHLPGRFTFQQMRAAIREINFTRKFLFTAMRRGQREIRQWQHPTMSAFIFLSWMHAVYANSFSLVPAYACSFLLLLLVRNYAKFNTDGPVQRGFVPPSWEELFAALFGYGNPEYNSIEPIDLGLRSPPLKRRRSPDSSTGFDADSGTYVAKTHVPKGKNIFRALGFVPDNTTMYLSADADHMEFPFANGVDYPKFSVKECLVHRKKDERNNVPELNHPSLDDAGSENMDNGSVEEGRGGLFHMEMDIGDIMRKDSSGFKDFDEEEINFNRGHAVVKTGKKAASNITKTATGLTEITGLNYLMSPIKSGVQYVVGPLQKRPDGDNTEGDDWDDSADSLHREFLERSGSMDESEISGFQSLPSFGDPFQIPVTEVTEVHSILSSVNADSTESTDPAMLWPEQNIDIEDKNPNKKLTDDLAEVKDKMHELTWHLFDDKVYYVKNSNACYFGDAKKPEKRRKQNVEKQLDKLLNVGQYSHSNPFIARVGLYIEPIIGASYSFLCLFRAGFNVFTWRDPMLTFWVSILLALVSFILFIFPWRIFLFLLGFVLVGPQNFVIRKLREHGRLPPERKRGRNHTDDSTTEVLSIEEEEAALTSQPVFRFEDRKGGNSPRSEKDEEAVDPREVHRVVIPYSPLLYQRFYDWPPEPQYAQVRREIQEETKSKALDKRNHGRENGAIPFARQELGRIRRRFHRRSASDNALPPLPPRRRAALTEGDVHLKSN